MTIVISNNIILLRMCISQRAKNRRQEQKCWMILIWSVNDQSIVQKHRDESLDLHKDYYYSYC